MHLIKKLIFRFPGHYITALVLSAALAAFRFSTLPEGLDYGYVAYEILSISGCFTVLIGALLTVSYFGAFDLFGYVFSGDRTGEKRKYRDYADYTEKKLEKRSREGYFFVPYYVVGAMLLLISRFFA